MKTIVLPGYSPHNKDWAEEVAGYLKGKIKGAILTCSWRHWEKGQSKTPNINYELIKIIKLIGKEGCNIIAKSFGTRMTMHLLSSQKIKINKVILCGIPTVGEEPLILGGKNIDPAKKLYSEGLSNISPDRVICFQNDNDPYVTYSQVKEFIGSIDKSIKLIEKPRSDHSYPYSEDFVKFLKD